MNLKKRIIERFFPPVKRIPAGVYHFQAPPDADLPYRLHLRIENDGTGILVINASTVLHLNETAAEYAYYFVQQTPPEDVARLFADRYPIPKEKASEEYKQFKEKIETLISTPDLDPETYLGVDRQQPYSSISVPYRLDCALTYRVNDEKGKYLAPLARVSRELLTDEWQTILKKAWDAGILHVVFTGGEPTLRPDLTDLVQYAEDLGMVTGMLTDGLRLTEKGYLQALLQNGLDHIMILLDPVDEQSWEAVRDTLTEDIFVTVHITIHHKSDVEIRSRLEKLAWMGVKSLSLTVDNPELYAVLAEARQSAARLGLSLVWDLPVPYSSFNPVSLELAEDEEFIRGAGKAWLFVEPDGDVLPAQGEEKSLGNLLKDPWEQVWKAARGE